MPVARLAAQNNRACANKEWLADPEMLNTAYIANLLGMSEEGARLKRKRHEILGLESAKRGIRYPAWQILENRQLLSALPSLLAMLGDDPWRQQRKRHPMPAGPCAPAGRRTSGSPRAGRTDR